MSGGKLPEGWVDTQLGNIVDYGKATKRVLSDVNDDTWVLELEDIEKESSKLLSTIRAGERPFKSTKNSFQKGDVLYGKLRPYLNKIIIAEEDGVCTTEIIPLSAEPSCCNKYIFYWLKSSTFLGYVNDVSYGVNMPRLGTADGLKAPLRLAPLAEQKIIAEKLDTLLAQVDSTKARLEQIPQILKRFRQAVLAAAVSGRLTKVWREKNQDSSSSGEWQQFALSELGVLSRGKSKHRPRNDPRLFGDTYPFIQTGEVANSLGRIKAATKFYSEFGLSQSKLFPQGTLCITIAANIADTAILDIDACFPDSVVGFIPKKNKSHVLFIKYLIDANKEDLEAYAPATAQKNINLKVLNDLRFPMPDIEEQHEIVRRVEQLFAWADTIEKQVNSALTHVNSLTQSILAKAFRGELTAQWRAENPSLISGENSAAALLEKIKAERAASGGKKTSRKKA
ncbi:restriction endonuclease subunit S [Salmonella enterica subsp. enterica serovar Kua]|nr:restriction endonuclease subunit S [Salmonella enterica subsp. houtenae serovar 44:z4,z23:-]EIB9775278.1 restriction endonuclease subunit S [Salmonella enterica subsp. enterica serovar Kua]EIB9811374.1 restriction endonuclease subunit S [Salmonella enterica subsp. enterica serovar Kua]EIU1134444.1 restriction endonuclease subunit S [Salmonella enterica subsp. enterica serovar Kua]